MTEIFRQPEIPTRFGALDDEAFTDGDEAAASLLREMARSTNLLVSRGDLIYRAAFDPNTSTEGPGAALSYATPHWQHFTPTPGIPVRKKYGVRSMRVRMRLAVDSGYEIAVFVGTSVRPSPTGRSITESIKIGGSGSVDVIDAEIPTREARDEVLSIYYRAIVNPSADPLMVTGTFGTLNTGTVESNTAWEFTDTAAAWNASGGSQPHIGGHYVYFSDASGNTPVHGPAEIRATLSSTQLGFFPPLPNNQFLRGSTYWIRKLPAVRLVSFAAYAVDRSL